MLTLAEEPWALRGKSQCIPGPGSYAGQGGSLWVVLLCQIQADATEGASCGIHLPLDAADTNLEGWLVTHHIHQREAPSLKILRTQ